MRDIKRILVHLTGDSRDGARLRLAATLANRFSASIEGLYVRPSLALPKLDDPLDWKLRNLVQQVEQLESEGRGSFDAVAGKVRAGAAYRVVKNGWVPSVAHRAKFADLVIVGQPLPDGGPVEYDFPAELVMTAPRPVLVLPQSGTFADAGQRIVLAWKTGREASQALADALPFFRTAASVTILTVRERESSADEVTAQQLAGYLARRGISATAKALPAAHEEISYSILRQSEELGADLMVMGAYGRSRLREFFLGGVTSEIMRHMNVPVLMAN